MLATTSLLSGSAEGTGVEEGGGAVRAAPSAASVGTAPASPPNPKYAAVEFHAWHACMRRRPAEILAGARASGPGCCVAAQRLSTAARAACYLRAQHCGGVRRHQTDAAGALWHFSGALRRCGEHAPGSNLANGCKALKVLEIQSTAVTEDGVARFQGACHSCLVRDEAASSSA